MAVGVVKSISCTAYICPFKEERMAAYIPMTSKDFTVIPSILRLLSCMHVTMMQILKPVLIAAITTMRALSAVSEGFSWERARQVAESWVLAPNGGHGRDNVFESSYSRT